MTRIWRNSWIFDRAQCFPWVQMKKESNECSADNIRLPGVAAREVPAIGRSQRLMAIPLRRPAVSLSLVAAILLLGGALYWMFASSNSLAYVTAPVSRGTVARAVSATGSVNPVLTITVGSYVSGVIQEIDCDFNTKVKKGQLCAKIDPRPYQTIVEQNRANRGNGKGAAAEGSGQSRLCAGR